MKLLIPMALSLTDPLFSTKINKSLPSRISFLSSQFTHFLLLLAFPFLSPGATFHLISLLLPQSGTAFPIHFHSIPTQEVYKSIYIYSFFSKFQSCVSPPLLSFWHSTLHFLCMLVGYIFSMGYSSTYTNEYYIQLLSQLVTRSPYVILESILLLKSRSSRFRSNRNENKTDRTARGTRGGLRNC